MTYANPRDPAKTHLSPVFKVGRVVFLQQTGFLEGRGVTLHAMRSCWSVFNPCIFSVGGGDPYVRPRLLFSPPIPPRFDYVNHMIRKKSVSIVNAAHSLSAALSP